MLTKKSGSACNKALYLSAARDTAEVSLFILNLLAVRLLYKQSNGLVILGIKWVTETDGGTLESANILVIITLLPHLLTKY